METPAYYYSPFPSKGSGGVQRPIVWNRCYLVFGSDSDQGMRVGGSTDHRAKGAAEHPRSLGQFQEKWDILNTNSKGLGLKKEKRNRAWSCVDHRKHWSWWPWSISWVISAGKGFKGHMEKDGRRFGELGPSSNPQ